jgi:hypothetical protein
VQNTIEGLAIISGCNKKICEGRAVRQFPFRKIHAGRQQVPPAMAQIIEYKSLVPF